MQPLREEAPESNQEVPPRCPPLPQVTSWGSRSQGPHEQRAQFGLIPLSTPLLPTHVPKMSAHPIGSASQTDPESGHIPSGPNHHPLLLGLIISL